MVIFPIILRSIQNINLKGQYSHQCHKIERKKTNHLFTKMIFMADMIQTEMTFFLFEESSNKAIERIRLLFYLIITMWIFKRNSHNWIHCYSFGIVQSHKAYLNYFFTNLLWLLNHIATFRVNFFCISMNSSILYSLDPRGIWFITAQQLARLNVFFFVLFFYIIFAALTINQMCDCSSIYFASEFKI